MKHKTNLNFPGIKWSTEFDMPLNKTQTQTPTLAKAAGNFSKNRKIITNDQVELKDIPYKDEYILREVKYKKKNVSVAWIDK